MIVTTSVLEIKHNNIMHQQIKGNNTYFYLSSKMQSYRSLLKEAQHEDVKKGN